MARVSRSAVLSKQSPGGRCTLYMRYAEAISRHLDILFELSYCEFGRDEYCTPPAMLIAEIPIDLSDDVIISPEDLTNGRHDMLAKDKLNELHQILDAVQEQLMEEWSNE